MDRDTYDQYMMQDAIQQRAIESQSIANAPMMHEQVQQAQAVLVEQTNPKNIVRAIILRLQGLEELPDGRKVKVAEAKLNKSGIDNIWFILDSHINQNIILTHLDEDRKKEISKIMNGLQNDLVDDLSLNWREYGIKKKTDLDTINDSILVNIYASLKRAEGQNEKNWLGKISVEQISAGSRMPSPKKEGFWSKFRL